MAEPNFDYEATHTFLFGIAEAIRAVERAQPEPGFQEVFVAWLDKYLAAAVLAEAAEGQNTTDGVRRLRTMLDGTLRIARLGEAIRRDP